MVDGGDGGGDVEVAVGVDTGGKNEVNGRPMRSSELTMSSKHTVWV